MPEHSESLLALVLSPKHIGAGEVRFVDGELRVTALGGISIPEGAFDGNQVASGAALGSAIAEFVVR